VVSVTPRPRFTPGERTPVPIGQEDGWAPDSVWTQRLEEKSLGFCRESKKKTNSRQTWMQRKLFLIKTLSVKISTMVYATLIMIFICNIFAIENNNEKLTRVEFCYMTNCAGIHNIKTFPC
jgi:hypothetical protein